MSIVIRLDQKILRICKFFVILPEEMIVKLNTPIEIAVKVDDKIIDVIKTSFLGKVMGRKLKSEN